MPELEGTSACTIYGVPWHPPAVSAGQGLPIIGKLLGDAHAQTTAQYAHLAADPVQTAADQVSSEIAALLNEQAA